MIAAPKARSHGLTTGGGALVTFTGISAASAVVVDNAAPTAAARIDTFFIRLPLLASRPVAAEGPRQGHHCSGAKSRKPVERRSKTSPPNCTAINAHAYFGGKQKASSFDAFLIYRRVIYLKELARCILVTDLTPRPGMRLWIIPSKCTAFARTARITWEVKLATHAPALRYDGMGEPQGPGRLAQRLKKRQRHIKKAPRLG